MIHDFGMKIINQKSQFKNKNGTERIEINSSR
jgi:hypothetical protein